jgi:D-alanine-D-alanine ligase
MDIAVLAGGRSPEHDISLRSAAMVLQHLDRARFRVWPVFLDRDGGFWPQRRPLLRHETWHPGHRATAHGPMRPGTAIDWLLERAHVAAVFPVLHGPFGEDGTVQGMLELYDLPFVGSGCAASAVAMDKLRSRRALAGAGVPQAAAYEPATALDDIDVEAEFGRLQAEVGLPCFCKVDCSGSSRGVQRVRDLADFVTFVDGVRGGFRRWFAEALVTGEEITVAVLGNADCALQPLPPIGIYPRFSDHFDERAKYEAGACDEIVPPRGWDAGRCEPVQQLAVRCHQALGCDGMSRTDMIVLPDGPVVLEVNTIPGMTGTSLLPKAAAAAGLPFPRLLDRLVDLALQRHTSRRGRAARPSAGSDRRRPAGIPGATARKDLAVPAAIADNHVRDSLGDSTEPGA